MILLLNILTTLYACVLVGQAVHPAIEALLSTGGIVHPDCGHQLGVMRGRDRMPHPGGSRDIAGMWWVEAFRDQEEKPSQGDPLTQSPQHQHHISLPSPAQAKILISHTDSQRLVSIYTGPRKPLRAWARSRIWLYIYIKLPSLPEGSLSPHLPSTLII